MRLPLQSLLLFLLNIPSFALECTSDAECVEQYAEKFCISGECAVCRNDDDCVERYENRPYCINNVRCVSCKDDSDCENPTPYCSPSMRCVQCKDDSDCENPTPYCGGVSCGECATNEHCTSKERPYCASGRCRQCSDPEPDGWCIPCFAPHSTVLTEARGEIQISDVKVNDKVLTASGKFKTVFTFASFVPPVSSPNANSPYINIGLESLATTIDMTPRHMLFLKSQKYPIEASKVKPGDYLMLQQEPGTPPIAHKVVSVKSTFANGGFGPITEDGTIVVNGIVASCYSNPLYQKSEFVTIFGIPVVHRQVFTHVLKSPIRLFCKHISSTVCWPPTNSTAPFKMPGIVLLDKIHVFTVRWGLQGVGQLLAGTIALAFYVLEWLLAKLTLAGTLCLAAALHRFLRHSKIAHDVKNAQSVERQLQ